MSRIKGKFARSYDDFIRRNSPLPDGLSKLVASFNPQKIADFGCGTGTVALGLAMSGYDITGVDISEDMLRVARRKARNHAIDLKFRHGDIANLNLRTEFDLILSLGNTVPLIYRIRDARKAFRNFARHLKPGGTLILQQLNYDRILKERPRTFAIDRVETQLRIKQYKYSGRLIKFTVTIVDHSYAPPKIEKSHSMIRPWRKEEMIEELKDAGFFRFSAYGDYGKSRFGIKSKDLILVCKKRP